MSAPSADSHEEWAPPPGGSDDPAAESELGATLGELATPALPPAQRRRLLRQLGRQLPRVHRRWVPDTVGQFAPHVPVRQLAVLREHHRGLDGDLLADRLVRHAARATAGVGAASGALAAVKWAAPPLLVTAPVLLCVETVAVVAIELKLVAELHEVYHAPVPGQGREKAAALLQSWTQQRGITPFTVASGGVAVALGTAARRQLAEQLARRFRRNLPTLAPLLAGAAAGGYLNRRATVALGRQLRGDLLQADRAGITAR